MRMIIATLVLIFSTMGLAQANTIQLTNFQLVWHEGTNELGGFAQIIDLDNRLDSFEVVISNFENSFNNEEIGLQGFINPLVGSGFTFASIELFSISGKHHEIMDTSAGTGFTDGGLLLFEGPVNFMENYGASLLVTEVSAVPEPAGYLMVLMGLGLIGGITRKKKSELRYAKL
jgi:hypothetical protein